MVSSKVKAAMGFQKSPATPKSSSSSSSKSSTVFSRSFGVYFPRSSSQVQPKPPDVTVADLLKLIDHLQERECRLKTELLEHKILKETVAIVPFLESEIASKNESIEKMESEAREKDGRIRQLEEEIDQLRKVTSSSSQRFQIPGLVEASSKSSLLNKLRNGNNKPSDNGPDHSVTVTVTIPEEEEVKEVRKEEVKLKVARIPKPPPLPSASAAMAAASRSSTSSSDSSDSSSSTASHVAAPVPPPPPPPPPPMKGGRAGVMVVRRVPEVVEFYHALMRRDSTKREGGGGGGDGAAAAASARNMIGEIENRSAHLLAVSVC